MLFIIFYPRSFRGMLDFNTPFGLVSKPAFSVGTDPVDLVDSKIVAVSAFTSSCALWAVIGMI